jgi:transcriptional regulator with XRE-family HTH domain
MDKDIATLLREIRSDSGWSQARIAREIGATQPTVNRLLHGQPDCKASTLTAIKALHKTLMRRRRKRSDVNPKSH